MAIFDDDQIADEKSIANMKLRYASMDKKTKVLSTQKSEQKLFEIANLLKRADRFFEYEKEKHEGEFLDFFREIQKVNLLELDELKKTFSELQDLDKQTPKLIKNPQSTEILNRQLAKNELLAIVRLLEICFDEGFSEHKKMLEQMALRRLKSFSVMFLGQEL